MLTKIPHGQAQIIQTYGQAGPAGAARRITRIKLPYTLYYDKNPLVTIGVHELIAENVVAVFEEILRRGLSGVVQEYNGCYNFRPVRGGRKPSVHSWAAAIDVEATRFPLGSARRLPESVIEIFRKYGAIYGGDFKRKDPMHFQWVTGY